MEEKKKFIVVAGKKPPPIGGQNLMVAELLADLVREDTCRVEHLDLAFTKDWKDARRFSFGKVREVLRVVSSLRRLARHNRVDLLLFPVGGPQMVPLFRDALLLPILRRYSRKLVLHFHAAGYAQVYGSLFYPLKLLSKKTYSAADEAIVMTNFGREDAFAAGISRTHVCPNFLKDTFDQRKIKAANPLSTPVILYLGHVYEEKGIFDLLDALGKVNSRFHLRVVGDCLAPWTPTKFISWIKEKGLSSLVEYVGGVDLPKRDEELAQADFLVFPSRAHESFGLVLAEAMMWKLPIVTFDWRGNKEVVGEDLGGVLMPFGNNVAQLSSAVEFVLENRRLWLRWGETNRNRFLEKFCKPESCSPLANLILTMASN